MGPTGGSEPLPWPEQAGGSGGSLEELDEELDDALGDFDETMGQGAGAESEVDILDPMGGGSSASASDQPVFEESGMGGEGGSVENESVAQRAASGASGGDSGGASGSESGSEEGGESGTGAGGSAPSGEAGNASTGEADEGETDIIPIPDDVGDGRNDDIVLRQIREAAMKERDPVLRERLWEEYRRIRDQR
jgi:hypothetical protein